MNTRIALLIIFGLFFIASSRGQTKSDIEILKASHFEEPHYSHKRKVEFLYAKSRNPIIRYNPISLTLGGMLFIYQKFISVQIGANCPYQVSCSAFSKQCIQKYGLIKGIALGSDRLMRCTRLASADLKISDLDEETNKIVDWPETYGSSHPENYNTAHH